MEENRDGTKKVQAELEKNKHDGGNGWEKSVCRGLIGPEALDS